METIQEKIEQARQIFLTDVDEETSRENLERINEWEQSLRANSAFTQWQENDISKTLIKEFKTTYKEASIKLGTDRRLTEFQRDALWATKDACLMVLSLLAKDAKGEVESVHKEIEFALSST